MPTTLAQHPLCRALAPGTLRALEAHAAHRRFAPGASLLAGGDRASWVHLLERGLVREFYVTPDGHEHTRAFVGDGGVTGSLLDLTSATASVTWIQALEETHTIAFRFDVLNALAAAHADLESLARRHAEALAVRKTMREYEMLALSASERLARWQTEHPHLDGRITRRLLASYLGITPAHLSRIAAARRAADRAARTPR
jgi:CRP-like cAMP-binding protein